MAKKEIDLIPQPDLADVLDKVSLSLRFDSVKVRATLDYDGDSVTIAQVRRGRQSFVEDISESLLDVLRGLAAETERGELQSVVALLKEGPGKASEEDDSDSEKKGADGDS